VIWPVSVANLSQALLDCHALSLGAGCHIAVDQRVGQVERCGPELAEQVSGEPAFGCFNSRAGMVGHQPTDQWVGMLNVTEVARTVERVETRTM
jgi:hypothetical protein